MGYVNAYVVLPFLARGQGLSFAAIGIRLTDQCDLSGQKGTSDTRPLVCYRVDCTVSGNLSVV